MKVIDNLKKQLRKLIKSKNQNRVYGKNITEGKITKGGRNKPPVTPRPPKPSAQKA